jgi:hypothetical protein
MSVMQSLVRRLLRDTPKGCCGVKFEKVDSRPAAASEKTSGKESGSCCRASGDTALDRASAARAE